MSLTRTHIAFLGIISIFTGLIGPGTSASEEMLSYLMTDMRWLSYSILVGLILAFALASLRKWSLFRLFVILIGLSSIVLLLMTISGNVESTRSGLEASGVAWGWLFIVVGNILLFLSYRKIEGLEKETRFSELIDTTIGMVGGFALACIAGILILSSLSFFKEKGNHEILIQIAESNGLVFETGSIQKFGNFSLEPYFSYNRGKNTLLASWEGGSGKVWNFIQNDIFLSGTLKNDLSPFVLQNTLYASDGAGYVYSGGKLILGSKTTEKKDAFVYREGNSVYLIHENGARSIAFTGIIMLPVVISEDMSTVIWISREKEKKILYKEGAPIASVEGNIEDISISPTGKNMMFLVGSGGEYKVFKNDTLYGKIPQNALSGSYQSNGSHMIYTSRENVGILVNFDMMTISRHHDEIREVFLEKEGGSYAYFARPKGEKTYCLFTRYKGTLCDLEGYMNPVLGADGGSVLFAGKKNGIWSIYRNTDMIVRNTNYSGSRIIYDYVFFDTTNPRTFLFIEKDPITGSYSYRKNGQKLPGTWKDVSTRVIFGYDNHILTSAKDENGWKLIEL